MDTRRAFLKKSILLSGAYGLYERRFAGRVETGAASFTDPFMGRVDL